MVTMRHPRSAASLLAAVLSTGCWGGEFTPEGSTSSPLASAELEAGAPTEPVEAAAPAPDAHVLGLEVAMPDAGPAGPEASPDAPEAAPLPPTPVQQCLASCPVGCCDLGGVCHDDAVSNDLCGSRASRADGICVNCTVVDAYCNADQECSIELPDGGRYVP